MGLNPNIPAVVGYPPQPGIYPQPPYPGAYGGQEFPPGYAIQQAGYAHSGQYPQNLNQQLQFQQTQYGQPQGYPQQVYR